MNIVNIPRWHTGNEVRAAGSVYVFMAALFVVTALVAFAPTSLRLIDEVSAGQRPMPALIVHVHAAAMSLWLLLLLAQTRLMHRARPDLHFRLGMCSLLLAPVMLAGMIGVAEARIDLLAGMAPEQANRIIQQLLTNIGGILLFPVFFVWALLARGRDNETHKRMMILATLVIMSPATGRLVAVTNLLPDFGLNGADARHLYLLLLLLPALVHDVVRRGAPHRAYVLGLIVMAPYLIAAHFLWGSAWWLETGPKLFGAG